MDALKGMLECGVGVEGEVGGDDGEVYVFSEVRFEEVPDASLVGHLSRYSV